MNKLSADPQASDTSVLASGTLVNREENSEYEIIDKSKEMDENSDAECEDEQFSSLDKEQQTKEIGVTSSVEIEQSLSGDLSNENELIQNESLMRPQDVKLVLNVDDIKQIVADLSEKRKKNLLFAKVIAAPSISKENSDSSVQREEALESKSTENFKEVENSPATEFEDNEICSVNEEQIIRSRSPESTEQNLIGVVSGEKELVLNESSTRAQDVKQMFNPDDIWKSIADLSQKRKKYLPTDEGLLVESEQALEFRRVIIFKEARNVDLKDKDMFCVDEDERIRTRSPDSTEQNLSGVVSEEKEFVLNESSTRSQDVKPVFNADDINKIIADLSRKRKKNLSVDKASSSKHVDEEQRIRSRDPESTEEILRKLHLRRRRVHFKESRRRSSSGSRSASRRYSRSQLRYRRHRYSSSSSDGDDDRYIDRNRPRSRSRRPIRHRHGRHACWTDSDEDERPYRTLELKKMTYFKRPFYDWTFGYRPFPPTGFFFPRVRGPPIYQPGVLPPPRVERPFPPPRVARPFPPTGFIFQRLREPLIRPKRPISSPAATGSSQSGVLPPSRVEKPFPPPKIARPFPPTGRIFQRVREPLIRPKRPLSTSVATEGSQSEVLPSRVERPFPHPATKWSNQSSDLPSSGVEKPFPPPAAPGGNQSGTLLSSSTAGPLPSRAVTRGKESGGLSSSGVGIPFPPPAASGGNQSGTLPSSSTAGPFPSQAVTWGKESGGGGLSSSGVGITFPPPAASGGNQSSTLPSSSTAGPFPSQAVTWGKESGGHSSSGVGIPFPPPAASGGNQSGTLPSSSTAGPFPSQAVTWGKESGGHSSSGVGIPFPPPAASGGNQSGTLPPSRTAELFPFLAAIWGNQFGYLPPSGVEILFPPPATSGDN